MPYTQYQKGRAAKRRALARGFSKKSLLIAFVAASALFVIVPIATVVLLASKNPRQLPVHRVGFSFECSVIAGSDATVARDKAIRALEFVFTRNQIVFPPFAKSKVAENCFTISFATFFSKAADAKIFSQQTEAVLNESKQELELVSEITRCIDGGSSTSAAA